MNKIKYIIIILLILTGSIIYATNNVLVVTGTSNPDATGTYYKGGRYNGVSCYSNGTFWIWWKSDWNPGVYLISHNKGDTSGYWISLVAGNTNRAIGTYTNDQYLTTGSLSVTNIP